MSRFFRIYAFALFFALLSAVAIAQPGHRMKISAKGTILDSKTLEPLYAATVKATSSDGGTGSFAITDTLGRFTLEVERPGKYSLEFSYMGYKPMQKEVNIFPGRANLGKFKLTEDSRLLREVETVAHSQRIQTKGDTLAYNADAYKVQDGASAEELVGKMPGIEVTSEGVKAQGETVQKILVDGKEFFDNDVKMALKSLPAEVLESVNVYDKKSDQAEFTGVDDGETVKAMDLITKSYRRNGTFGKVFGGVGSNFDFDKAYWNTGFNINMFNGNRRITLQGMSNNVNERNFSNDDMAAGGGMMMGRQWGATGVARTNGFGVNFSDEFRDGKVKMDLSYFFNQNRVVNGDTTYTDDLNRTASQYSASSSLNHSMSHRVGGRITIKPSDRDEIMIRPSLNFQSSDGNSISSSRSWNHSLDSVWSDGKHLPLWEDVLSRTNNISHNENDSWNLRTNVLWRHRLNKPGRTFSIRLNGGASGSDSEHFANKDQLLGGSKILENQKNANNSKNSNFGGNLQWTEPLATGLNLSLRYEVSYQKSERETRYDFFSDEEFKHWERHDTLNTNTYIQKNLRNIGEVGLSYNKGTFRANAAVRLQNSKLDGEQDYFLKGIAPAATSKTYFSVLPNLRLEYRTKKGTQFRMDYRANSNNPSVGNLQESVNTTNRLNYSTGNPNLDQSITHRLFMNMIYTNTETAQNFMIFGGFNSTQDQISNEFLINRTQETLKFTDIPAKFGYEGNLYKNLSLAPGASINRPVNRNGYMSAHLNFGYGFPFDAILSNVNISLGGNYNVNPSYKVYYEYNAQGKGTFSEIETKTRTLGFNPRLHVSSNISSDLNFNLMYMPSFQWVDGNESSTQSKDFINHNLNASLNWTFWRGFTTDQSVNYSRYGGPAQPEAIEQWIWNASIGKKFLKGNKAEIKLQAYDILGSNKGFSRNVGDSNITSTFRNFMPRYFLCTFTYKITNYKGTASKSSSGDGNRGGGHGGFPGGGHGPGGFPPF
ncbi:MAG: TonB-dependent receptor [Bacteroidales bacterium]|nr:TonB-dependent receptor [Bacteroidales bacterium]